MWLLTDGCKMPSWRAAAAKIPVSATFTKTWSRRTVMMIAGERSPFDGYLRCVVGWARVVEALPFCTAADPLLPTCGPKKTGEGGT
jgi:hypothetical protein